MIDSIFGVILQNMYKSDMSFSLILTIRIIHNGYLFYRNRVLHLPSFISSQFVYRKAVKDSIQIFGKIVSQHPDMSQTWDRCLSPAKDVFTHLLSQSLKGGGHSAVVKFICLMSHDPQLFTLLRGSLAPSIPLMFNSLKSSCILNSMCVRPEADKSKNHGSGLVDAIFTFVLRICRGGHKDIALATKEMRDRNRALISMTDVRNKKLRRRRDRRDSDSGSQESDVDVEQSEAPSGLLDEWKEELEADCTEGRELLRPYLGELLLNLEILMSQRRFRLEGENEHHQQTRRPMYVGRRRVAQRTMLPPTSVLTKELEILTELSRFTSRDVPTACKLIQLLLLSLPKRAKRSARGDGVSYRLRMILASIRELLGHLGGLRDNQQSEENIAIAESTLTKLNSALMKQMQVG